MVLLKCVRWELVILSLGPLFFSTCSVSCGKVAAMMAFAKGLRTTVARRGGPLGTDRSGAQPLDFAVLWTRHVRT